MRKLLVEFEGGPACFDWGEDESPLWMIDGNSTLNEAVCSCQDGNRQTPWLSYMETDEATLVSNGLFPPLGTCRGITDGLIRFGGEALFNQQGNLKDIPIGIRKPSSEDGTKSWWEHLDDNIQDWSYLLIPHCTLDWNLGNQESAQLSPDGVCEEEHFFRGGRNVQAVMEWVNSQFLADGGVEALITLPNGKIGGCSSSDEAVGSILSSAAPIIFANGIIIDESVNKGPLTTRKLIMVEGSILLSDAWPTEETFQDLWDAGKSFPAWSSTMEGLNIIQELIRDTDAKFVWFRENLDGSDSWVSQISREKEGSFHVFTSTAASDPDVSGTCPLFTFPDDHIAEVEDVNDFIQTVVRTMAWSSASGSSTAEAVDDPVLGVRLTFLTIMTVVVGVYMLSWAVYYCCIALHRKRNGTEAKLQSPHDLWLTALTHHPRLFLLVSLSIPFTLSYLGISKSGYTVQLNLDFDSYLTIDTDLEMASRSISDYRIYQDDSVDIEDENCRILEEAIYTQRKLFDELPIGENQTPIWPFSGLPGDGENLPARLQRDHRDLQYDLYWGNGPILTIMYENRNGGNVFEPDVLQEIRDFEQSIYDFPGFDQHCLTAGFRCLPFDSLIPLLFPAGYLTNNIVGVLGTFVDDQTSLWKVDQHFSAENLASNITRTFIWLRDGDEASTNEFMKSLYTDLLWKADRDKRYPNLLFTWENAYLTELEANRAVIHDALWASGSFIFVGIMLFVKVRSLFIFLASVLGLILSFSSAYYWCLIHFDISEITILHVSSLFVMIGIGVDDIFLMVDSFEHTKIPIQDEESTIEGESGETNEKDAHHCDASDASTHDKDLSLGSSIVQARKNRSLCIDDFEVLRGRMKSAYQTAGSMMLVSSLTTAVCFFSNAFAIVIVIREFGIYMGMVVLINFFHVMTILPSAILVNEMYIKPWTHKLGCAYRYDPEPASNETIRQGSQLELDVPSEDGLFDESIRPCIGITRGIERVATSSGDVEDAHRSIRGSSGKESRHQLDPTNDESAYDFTTRSENGDRGGHASDKFDIRNAEKEHGRKRGGKTIGGAEKLRSNASKLSRMDRWLVLRYSPFVVRRCFQVAAFLMLLSAVLGVLGALTFEVSDGSIILFSEKYNLGRLTKLAESYFDGNLNQSIERDDVGIPDSGSDDNIDDGGNDGNTDGTSDTTGTGGGGMSSGDTSGGSSGSDSGSGTQAPSVSESGIGTQTPSGSGSGRETPAPQAAPNPGSSPTVPTFGGSSGGSEGSVPTTSSGGGGGVGTGGGDNEGFSPGDTSGLPACSQWCQNGGICNFAGSCTCLDGWTGGDCAVPICPSDNGSGVCSGNGDCLPHPNGVSESTLCQCFEGYSGSDCNLRAAGATNIPLQRKQSIVVSLVWGAERLDQRSDLWTIRGRYERPDEKQIAKDSTEKKIDFENSLDVADPTFQQWMLEVVKMARNKTSLAVNAGSPTWIEIVETVANEHGIGFPVPKDLFSGFLQLLKGNNNEFASLVQEELGTTAPGLAGSFLFASVTFLAEVKGSLQSLSSDTYMEWSSFVDHVNTNAPESISPVVAQSRTFLNAHRAEETISSTGLSWLVSNLVCLLIILGFTRSLCLSAMVTIVIILIFLCLAGVLFGIFRLPFGPVEALGVSIFIGLSSNYNLHVVHAYQHSTDEHREGKVKSALFATGSPIIASALSTIGGCIFLFGCRTYVFMELGLLICSITLFSLIFSMSFLPAWLTIMGPLPRKKIDQDGIDE